MNKFLLSSSFIIIFAIYAFYAQSQLGQNNALLALAPPLASPVVIVDPPTPLSQPKRSSAPNTSRTIRSTPVPNVPNPTPTPTISIPASTPVPTRSNSPYKDGVFVGSVADAYYGNVQVQVSVQNGKITDVQFLQYPNDRNTSIEINSQAVPYLQSEAIQAQSANVDIVSGATETSLAFRESMNSALGQAII